MHDFGISSYDILHLFVAFVIVDLHVFGYSSILITSEITIFHICLRTPDVVRNPALNTYVGKCYAYTKRQSIHNAHMSSTYMYVVLSNKPLIILVPAALSVSNHYLPGRDDV